MTDPKAPEKKAPHVSAEADLGDLDVEADALLDSLFADDAPASLPGPQVIAPAVRQHSPHDDTVVGQRAALGLPGQSQPAQHAYAPSEPDADADAIAFDEPELDEAAADEATGDDAALGEAEGIAFEALDLADEGERPSVDAEFEDEPPTPVPAAPERVQPPAPLPVAPEPSVAAAAASVALPPRPGAAPPRPLAAGASAPPAPRAATPSVPAAARPAAPAAVPPPSPAVVSPPPPAVLAAAAPPELAEAAPESAPTLSLSEELEAPPEEAAPAAAGTPAPGGTAPGSPAPGGPADLFAAAASSGDWAARDDEPDGPEPDATVVAPAVAEGSGTYPDERAAAAHLAEQAATADTAERAAWFEREARAVSDPAARLRLLAVAAELRALTGELGAARKLATEAASGGTGPALAARSARSIALAEGDHKAAVLGLDAEVRNAATPEARTHAAWLAAEVTRVALHDATGAGKRLDALARNAPGDARVALSRYALAHAGGALSKHKWPEGVASLRDAAEELEALRAPGPRAPSDPVVAPLVVARRAVAAGDRTALLAALTELMGAPALGPAVRWWAASVAAADPASRARAVELLDGLLPVEPAAAAAALASRALELGDTPALYRAISTDTFELADGAALVTLSGADRAQLRSLASEFFGDSTLAPLAAALASLGGDPAAEPDLMVGSEEARRALLLGRLLVPSTDPDHASTVATALSAATDDPDTRALAGVLTLEAAVSGRDAEAVSSLLAEWPGAVTPRDRALASALVRELSGDTAGALDGYQTALSHDALHEGAVRAAMQLTDPETASGVLANLVEGLDEGERRGVLRLELALRRGMTADDFDELVRGADDDAPALALPRQLGEVAARHRGEESAVLDWMERRRAASTDAVERALLAVRQAFLVAESDLPTAARLVAEAATARPNDVGLRELGERLDPGGPAAERGAWREAAAGATDDVATQRYLAGVAALEYERAGDLESASRVGELAASLGVEMGRLVAERTSVGGQAGARLAEQWLERARSAADPVDQRELYERLSRLDELRGDASSAQLWQSAILECDPKYLPALWRVERALIGAGRDEELEPVATTLAGLLEGGEASAHAWMAARLRARVEWKQARELVELAAALPSPELWALRRRLVHARVAADDAAILAASETLLERASHPLDAATLALRAAEAASRTGQVDRAVGLLDHALDLTPDNIVALSTRAELLEGAERWAPAAEALELLAQTSTVPAHQREAWTDAATLWLDRLDDKARGRAALERAAELDIMAPGVFERLRDLLVAAGQREPLAELLQRRLDGTTDPDERVALEVTRGRALADMGDAQAARAALEAALEASPDHVDALDAFATLCLAEGDAEAAEQALVRLVRLSADPERQAALYRRLGALYEGPLARPDRAELAWREVLKRQPNDADATLRLVEVLLAQGQGAAAIELATAHVERAGSPEESRDRTLWLAALVDQSGDRKKAEAILEKARKAHPHDGALLRAVVELHQRHGEAAAAHVLLDRTANEARRALGTGRFEPAMFEALAVVSELKGNADAAALVQATVAALEGRPTEVEGVGGKAGDARLDDALAPEPLGSALRSLLRKGGEAIDAAYPLDLKALRATPAPAEAAALAAEVRELGKAFGLPTVELLVSSALGTVCQPVASHPPQVVMGKALVDSDDADARRFLVLRALKVLQLRGAALSRTAPIDLWPVFAGFLLVFAPDWRPQGADARKTTEARTKIGAATPKGGDPDVAVLALEITGSIGNRASQIGTALFQLANRVALLATGDPTVALRAVAMASGLAGGPPEDPTERTRWVIRNAEARDLCVFSVSEAYAEARKKSGVG